MDEPSMGLAPILVEEIFDIIQEIRQEGVTILLVEQNANMALSVADRGYVLETGVIDLEGTAKDLAPIPACERRIWVVRYYPDGKAIIHKKQEGALHPPAFVCTL